MSCSKSDKSSKEFVARLKKSYADNKKATARNEKVKTTRNERKSK